MPDPEAGGSVEGKRREYYRKRMFDLGWQGCSIVDLFNPWTLWKFVEQTLRVHEEAMGIYPNPKPKRPAPPVYVPPPPVLPVTPLRPPFPVRCNRCFPGPEERGPRMP